MAFALSQDPGIDIDGSNLSPEVVEAVVKGRPVRLLPTARTRVEQCRSMVDRIIDSRVPVYGISTGVGYLYQTPISSEQAKAFQRNIVRSHSAGVGPSLSIPEVRAMMLLRANTLAGGYSGVRAVIIDTLLEMLTRQVHPIIPEQGSLGASGDLAPLAHLALVLIGEGEALYQDERLAGAEAMSRAGIELVDLEAKEGIALINGTQLMSGLGTLFLLEAERLAEVADIAGALTVQALRGTDRAFRPLLQSVRPHPGQVAAAAHILELLEDSKRVVRENLRVHDAYSLRCMPQVHGAVRQALAHLREIMTVEINSATDNPLLFPADDEVLSGGNFHGEPLALALDYSTMAVAVLASISERRIERLVNPELSGLPPFLAVEGGLNSGYMLAQYTAASLVSENKVLAHPACVDSIPTSANQEDHVSMGAFAARKARTVLQNSQQVLAIELVVASQALEFSEGELGRPTEGVYRAIRAAIPPLGEDRVIADDFRIGLELVRSGIVLKAAHHASVS